MQQKQILNSISNKFICKKLAISCHLITSFHEFGFHLERILSHICMRFLLWFCWFLGIYKLCIPMYFYDQILCISKSKKLLCEKLAFSCHCITSFHESGFNLEGFLYQICMRVILRFWCSEDSNFYSIYFHYISCYYMNHLFYCSCTKLKLVMQFLHKQFP